MEDVVETSVTEAVEETTTVSETSVIDVTTSVQDEPSEETQETTEDITGVYVPAVTTTSEDYIYYDVALNSFELGYINGTITDTSTVKLFDDFQEKLFKELTINSSLVCILIGVVIGLLITLHIKRR